MKTKLLFVLFIIFSLNSKAQLDSFKLASYKLTDLKRQGIDIDFDLSGSSGDEKLIGSAGDINRVSFASYFSGEYFLSKYTRKYQGSISAHLNGNFGLSNYSSENLDENNAQNVYSGISFGTYNRFYFDKEYFFGFSASVGLNYNQYRSDSKDYLNDQLVYDDEHYRLYKNYHAVIPVSIGKGRIEPVEDAQQTIFILKELKKNDRLTREPSTEEILTISSKVSELKNERILDARLKKIYELKQLDSLLQTLGLIKNDDINYFTVINDMWDFGGLQSRFSGMRFTIEYLPQLFIHKSDYERESNDFQNNLFMQNDNKNTEIEFINTIGAHFTWEKPFKQMFQNGFSFSIEYGTSQTKYEETSPDMFNSEYDTQLDFIGSSLYYRFGIYPNTRTDFFIDVSATGKKEWGKGDIEYESLYLGTHFRTGFNYYVSPKLRLSFNYRFEFLNLDNLNNNQINRENLFHSTNFSLRYSIF